MVGGVYNYTNHLGNASLSNTKDLTTQAVVIMEENNYYPFGLKHKNYNTSQKIYNKSGLGVPPENTCGVCPRPYKYNYKFNGQELQEDLGLNMYDMDFRDYDPAVARWVVLDPVVHHSLSPYNAFDNNPVFWADPSGADSQTLFDLEGGKHTVSGDDVVSIWKSSDANEFTAGDVLSSFGYNISTEGNFDGSMEPPISFLGKNDSKIMRNVFKKQYNKYKDTNGNNIFRVYGHGTYGGIFDGDIRILSALKFNDAMSQKSPAWEKAMKNNEEIILVLYTCLSASAPGDDSIAQKITALYKNVTIVGFDGYVIYEETGNIVGVDKIFYSNDRKGDVVIYKGGKETYRNSYNKLK